MAAYYDTQTVDDALLGLCATTTPWWQAHGYRGSITRQDLTEAGLQVRGQIAPLGKGII